MNKNDFSKTLGTIIFGIVIGSLVVFIYLGQFNDDTSYLESEIIDLTIEIDDLKDFITLHASCELGDKNSCDNLSKVIENDKDFNEMWISPTGQIRKF